MSLPRRSGLATQRSIRAARTSRPHERRIVRASAPTSNYALVRRAEQLQARMSEQKAENWLDLIEPRHLAAPGGFERTTALTQEAVERLVRLLVEALGEVITRARQDTPGVPGARFEQRVADLGFHSGPAVEQLTAREREVAERIARGLTNRQIADDLVISERTADKHVSNILGKLGLASRAQISAWVVKNSLSHR